MKQTLSILTFLCLFLLFCKGEEVISDSNLGCLEERETFSTPHDGYSSTYSQFSFNKESKYELSLTSRAFRNSLNENERLFKMTGRLCEGFLLKGCNMLQRISETTIISHTLNYFSLRHKAGYLIFALRKILI